MNEITKLYENAEIEPEKKCYYWDCPYSTGMPANDIPYAERNCQDCNNPDKAVYPPFTAEKQLELIKWLMKYDEIHGDYDDGYGFSTLNYSGKYKKDFVESLASVINNNLWQDLTDTDKVQIKEILE